PHAGTGRHPRRAARGGRAAQRRGDGSRDARSGAHDRGRRPRLRGGEAGGDGRAREPDHRQPLLPRDAARGVPRSVRLRVVHPPGCRARHSGIEPVRAAAMTVSWWYFAVSVWGAAFTLVALRPPKRPIALVGVTFFAAWLCTELALVHLVWQVAATVGFVAAGALRSWPGWAGLGISLLSWAGLLSMVTAASRTHGVLERALDDA